MKNDTISKNRSFIATGILALGFVFFIFEGQALAQNDGKVDLVAGPTLGVSLHYGPDYESASSGDKRGPSFFAIGPTIGGYLGLDFKRPEKTFNFELGLTP
jgi:hypothetical protein